MAIWSKGGDNTDALVHEFTVGDDWLYDRQIAPYDCLGCIAHATMLGQTGIISAEDSAVLVRELQKLHREFLAGAWTVESTDEDVHSRIEALLTERVGEPGMRLHTGRSRNDQVLTATRLWLKDKLLTIADQLCQVVDALCAQAQEHEFVPLPGYTHLQRGMPSSMGMFFGGHAAGLLESLILLDGAYQLADSCPLGSGASYGSGLPLDRALCTKLLGFARGGSIAMVDANSRGKVETAALDALNGVITDISRLSADVIFFVSAEAGFLRLSKGFTTGSSIMPQKRNPDIFELLRGRAARFLGLRTGLSAMTLGLHSGYSRDLQDTKPLLIDGLKLAEQALVVVSRSVSEMEPVLDNIEPALTPDLYATDEAFRLVREEGMPFREAYIQVGQNLDKVEVPSDHEGVLRQRTHAGSTGDLGLEDLRSRCAVSRQQWQHRSDELHGSWKNLLEAIS